MIHVVISAAGVRYLLCAESKLTTVSMSIEMEEKDVSSALISLYPSKPAQFFPKIGGKRKVT